MRKFSQVTQTLLNLFRFFALRQLTTKPTRTALTGLGMALGVALFISVQIINRATLESFQESIEAISGKAALTVSLGEQGFSESVVDDVAQVEGVQSAVPMIESRGFFHRGSELQSLLIFGVDLLREQGLRTYKTVDEKIIDDPLVFLNQPDSLILTNEFATKHNIKIDDKIELASATGLKTFTVRGLLSPTGPAKAYGGGIAIMDIDGARFTFGKEGKVDRVDIVAKKDISIEDLQNRIQNKLGPSFAVQAPDSQSESLKKMVSSFQAMLTFLSSLALVVGIFLVANTVAISIAERRREIGALRAIGTTRSALLTSLLAEVFVLGSVSSLIGAGLGRLLSMKLLHYITVSMSHQFMTPIEVTTIHFSLSDLWLALFIGVTASLLAAFFPAYSATKISPVEALRPKGTQASPQKAKNFLFLLSILSTLGLIYIGLAAHFKLGLKSIVLQQINAPLGVLAGAGFSVPLVILILKSIQMGSSRFFKNKIIARLGLDNLLRNPSRTGSNVLSLIVGLMLVIVVSAINLSFRETISSWADRVLAANSVVITSNGRLVDFQVQAMKEELRDEINRIEGVSVIGNKGAQGFRYTQITHEQKKIAIKAYDEPAPEWGFHFIEPVQGEQTPEEKTRFGSQSDDLRNELGRKLFDQASPSTLVSQSFVAKFNKRTGDQVTLNTPTGPLHLQIIGVVNDYAHPNGVIYLSRDMYKVRFNDHLCTSFSVRPKDITQQQLKTRLEFVLTPKYGLIGTLPTQIVQQIKDVVDQSFAFNRAVEAVALLVGLIGLLNTMLIHLLERTREIGMLRALGMSRSQLIQMIFFESLTLGTLGSIVACGLGSYLSFIWVTTTMSVLLGWNIDFHFPLSSVTETLVLGVVIAVFASLLPARRAAALKVKEALNYE